MNSLKSLRTKYGISRPEIARLSGLSLASIGHYETGKRVPSMRSAKAIVMALRRLIKSSEPITIEGLFLGQSKK